MAGSLCCWLCGRGLGWRFAHCCCSDRWNQSPHFTAILCVRIAQSGHQHFVLDPDPISVGGQCGDQRRKKHDPIAGSERDPIEDQQRPEVTGMAYPVIGPTSFNQMLVSDEKRSGVAFSQFQDCPQAQRDPGTGENHAEPFDHRSTGQDGVPKPSRQKCPKGRIRLHGESEAEDRDSGGHRQRQSAFPIRGAGPHRPGTLSETDFGL